jgi:hypothetical protein
VADVKKKKRTEVCEQTLVNLGALFAKHMA